MLAKQPTEPRIVDCPDCEATGYANEPGNVRCRLCGGERQLAIVVATGAEIEAEWDAIHELRVRRMPELFVDDVVSADTAEYFNALVRK